MKHTIRRMPKGAECISTSPPQWGVPGVAVIVQQISSSRYALRRAGGGWVVRTTGSPLTFRGLAKALEESTKVRS